MRVSELRAREPFDEVLRSSLARGWSELLGTQVQVSAHQVGQAWFLSWPFGMYHLREPSSRVRRFLADGFRYTPRRWRLPAQFLLGTLMSTKMGVRHGARFAFGVTPPVAGAEDMLVMPGNQRIRVFDFRRARVRVLLKDNFGPKGMRRELAFRTEHQADFLMPALDRADDGTWFEEAILDGYVALPRSAPWVDQVQVAEMALVGWEAWTRGQGTERLSGSECATTLARHVQDAIGVLDDKRLDAGAVISSALIDSLVARCDGLDEVDVVLSHGDFQPGNVMVAKRDSTKVVIIDWENVARRFSWYDRMVLGFASRYGGDLAGKMQGFVDGQAGSPHLNTFPSDRQPRAGLVTLFCLEELRWHVDRAAEGRFVALPPALVALAGQVRRYLGMVA